jgi:hypothetical protein
LCGLVHSGANLQRCSFVIAVLSPQLERLFFKVFNHTGGFPKFTK